MSRKREIRRAKDAEMARQMGVKTLDDKARDLVARGRVGHLELRPKSITLQQDRDGFFARRRRSRLHLNVGTFLVDNHGVHLVNQVQWATEFKHLTGTLELDDVPRTKVEQHYERPARFFLVATMAIDDDTDLFARPPNALGVQTSDNKRYTLDDKVLVDLCSKTPMSMTVDHSGHSVAGAALCLPGVHKVAEEIVLGLENERVEVRFTIGLRL